MTGRRQHRGRAAVSCCCPQIADAARCATPWRAGSLARSSRSCTPTSSPSPGAMLIFPTDGIATPVRRGLAARCVAARSGGAHPRAPTARARGMHSCWARATRAAPAAGHEAIGVGMGLSQRHRAGRIGRCGACAAAQWCVFFLECLAVAPGNQEVGSMVGSISVRTRAPAPRVGRAWPSRGERTP